MKTFHCDHCGALVFFENVTCLTCGHALGFLPDIMDLAALEQVQQDQWRSLAAESAGRLYRPCANGRIYAVCNWMVPVDDPEELCFACRMNAVIPDLSITANIAAWHKMEVAKRRLIYTLRLLSLSTDGFSDKWWPRLQFCFLTDVPGAAPILTGHDGGVITMNIDEADDVERFKRRTEFHEPHRTLIGHFRHESGHYFWDALIASSPWLEPFRTLFGNEQVDYTAALANYYSQGQRQDWAFDHVSAYASAHPWEDWAETWSHYLQMRDLLETAGGFGLSLRPKHPSAPLFTAEPRQTLVGGVTFNIMMEHWLPLTYALNSLNRGIGEPDFYPHILSQPVLAKLRFVHDVIGRQERAHETTSEAVPTLQYA